MVKILGLAIVRTGNDIPEPIPCTLATDLSSFGFFQRPVRTSVARYGSNATCVLCRLASAEYFRSVWVIMGMTTMAENSAIDWP
jgi:hypothetical protein